MNKLITLYWDFFGTEAAGTARHYLKHLNEFLERQQVPFLESGVLEENATYWSVFCKADAKAAFEIGKALKPRRFLEENAP